MKAHIFLADGLEEVECLGVVDLLRRGGIEVSMVAVGQSEEVTGSHNITMKADCLFEEADFSDTSLLVLPGGMPGTSNLAAHTGLKKLLLHAYENHIYIGAICAAPSILGELGCLEGKHAVCYPGFETQMKGAILSDMDVVTDGKVITAKGLGVVFDFGLELLRLLKGEAEAKCVRTSICFSRE